MIIFTDANGLKVKFPKKKKVTWRISAYSLVINSNKLLTVIPVWSNLYELPGGGIREKEDIAKGIQRECLEETGYMIKTIDPEPFYYGEEYFYQKAYDTFHHSIILVFRAKIIKKSNTPAQQSKEIRKVKWVNIADFNTKNTHNVIYSAIRKLQQSRQETHKS